MLENPQWSIPGPSLGFPALPEGSPHVPDNPKERGAGAGLERDHHQEGEGHGAEEENDLLDQETWE